MPTTLTQQEIRQRMIELRNLRKLHAASIKRNTILTKENKQLKARIVTLEQENKELKAELTDIKYQLTELQTIIFKKRRPISSSDENDDDKPRTPRTGDSYKRPIPKESEVTATIRIPLKRVGSRRRTKIFFVEDIPLDTKKIVTRYEVEQIYVGGHWVGGMAIPSAPVILGDNVRMLISTLITIQRLSYAQVVNLLLLLFRIHVSEGEIKNILEREAHTLLPQYEALKESIREERYNNVDESGWPINGQSSYGWSMTGESGNTVYILGQSRGKGVAEDLRGNSQSVLITDDYGAYRTLARHHQLCFAHLLRKFRDIAQSLEFSEKEKVICIQHYDELKLVYRDLKEILTTEHPIKSKEVFVNRFRALATESPPDPKPLQRIKATLMKNIEKYLTCLTFPFIPLTNNVAERSLRHVVLKRKISFGSATHGGAQTLSTLLSVLLSLWKRDPMSYFERYREMRV